MKNQRISFLSGLILICALFMGLTACQRMSSYVENPIPKNLPARQRELLVDLSTTGMQIIKQGMRFTFVIPTDCFFAKETRELKSHREKDLDRLAEFIHRYTNYFIYPSITITGYTDKTWIYPESQKLSMHYAETIATFLREDGIDSSIISVRGEGSKHPIASNHYPMGSSFNRRVEVVISYIPVPEPTPAQLEAEKEQKAQQAAQWKAQLKVQREKAAQEKALQNAQWKIEREQKAQQAAQQNSKSIGWNSVNQCYRAACETVASPVSETQQLTAVTTHKKKNIGWRSVHECYGAACSNVVPVLKQKSSAAKIKNKKYQSENTNKTHTQYKAIGWSDVNQCFGAGCT